jgi:hypothetical protein
MAEQALPKVPSAEPAASSVGMESDLLVELEELSFEESSEPQAAMPMERMSATAARPVRRRVVLVMVVPLVVSLVIAVGVLCCCEGDSVLLPERIGPGSRKFRPR